MKGMFFNCINLQNINLLSFDTKNVVNKRFMFKSCESLQNNLDLSSFDYNSVIKINNKISNFGKLNKYEILSSDYTKYDYSFKIIIMGDSVSGKDIFEDSYAQTIGFDFKTFNARIKDKTIRLQFWVAFAQEVYGPLLSLHFGNSSVAIIVYAVNDIKTFEGIDYWIEKCKSHCSPDAKLFLVGNKIGINEYE